jgi:hypothetical protein
MEKLKMFGYIIHCDGCLMDIKFGAKDLERVSDHTFASSPRYKTESEAYWAGVAKAMERDAKEESQFEEQFVETYER